MPVALRRAQLIDAAVAVAIRDGIEHTTIRAVAAEAGVSLGVVHYCFADKAELLRAVNAATGTANLAGVIASIDGAAGIRELLQASAQHLARSITERRAMHVVAFELTVAAVRDPELAPLVEAHYRTVCLAAETFLREVAAAARVRWTIPVPVLARLAVAMHDGLALDWLVEPTYSLVSEGIEAFATFLESVSEPLDGAGQ